MRTVCLALLVGASLHAQALPDGRGKDVVLARCVVCHETDLVSQHRLSRAAWGRSVDKMVGWGALVPADERDVLLDYLAFAFSPAPIASHPPNEAGEGVYRRACLLCHAADIISQQRLTRAGWGRSVDKMIGWGAAVDASEKDALLDFLVAGRRR